MQEARPHTVTLVLGGVRSGKSRFAQQMASHSASVVFIATAKPGDEEMRRRIEHHRRSRSVKWKTLEVPLDLDAAISDLHQETQLTIVDCLTVYLANVMSQASGDESAIRERTHQLCSALKQTKSSVVLVSNEVGSGVHPPTAVGRLYCDLLGELNQQVAALADNVVLMVAGVPLVIKGRLPAQVPLQSGSGREVPEALEQSQS
jgi:adenosylcobinamide kinase / adenosylcobinamide-phosphate guanylyltransferase